ncbi:MAG: hypothetical protein U9N86_16945 [Bacteroidota bacterium]|nr:hypothetical protein [Bacteroidota bacterium]
MNRFVQILFFLLTCSLQLVGQTSNSVDIPITISIPEVALVDFQGTSRLITVNSPDDGQRSVEQIITQSTDDNTWLNYSSIVPPGVSNYISVYISDGNLPPATFINLNIGDDVSAGRGATGSPSGEIILSRYPQNIITGIGSCYTGRGINKGHQLFFSVVGENADLVKPGNNNYRISVTYTIASTE